MNESTNYRLETKKKIRSIALRLFLKKGIRQVKMDDIANELSISKRTLYELYETKEDLLMDAVKLQDEIKRQKMVDRLKPTDDCIEVLLKVITLAYESITTTSPMFFDDLRKYPVILKYMEESEAKNQEENCNFFNKGVEEGYFLPTVNYPLVNKICKMVCDNMMATRIYKQYPQHEIFYTIIQLFFRSVCTLKGIERIDNLLVSLSTQEYE